MARTTTQTKESSAGLFIVEDSDSDWKVRSYLREWCGLSSAIDIATGYFGIGSLLALDGKWEAVDHFRILMGDEVSMRTKRAFAEGLKKIAQRLDGSLEAEKSKADFLPGVPASVTPAIGTHAASNSAHHASHLRASSRVRKRLSPL